MKKKLILLTLSGACLLFPQKAFAAEQNDVARHYDISKDGGTFTADTDGNYHYVIDDTTIKNAFLFDGTYTYYLQNDGTPMKDRLTYHPDGEHVIYFDSDGHEVFDKDARVKRAIDGSEIDEHCYFGTYGFMVTDQIVFMGGDPYYYNAYGVMEDDGWFRFADGNFGYAASDGYLMNNKFGYNPYGQYVFYHWNGQVARGLVTDGNYYYYMDEKDGHLLGAWEAKTRQEGSVAGTSKVEWSEYDMAMLGDNYFTRNVKDNSFTNYIKKNGSPEDEVHLFVYRNADGTCTDSETKQPGVYITTRGIMVGSNKADVEKAYTYLSSWDGKIKTKTGGFEGERLNELLAKPYMNLPAHPEAGQTMQQAVSCDDYLTETDFHDDVTNSAMPWLSWRQSGIRFYYDRKDTVIAIEYYWHHTANEN